MKLLVLTQKIDINDDLLGFMHGWLIEFSRRCESVIAIGLGKGEYKLPANVKVLSLGKEQGRSRLKYLFRFYKYIWQERKNYDVVLVHMNREYVILGGLLWRPWGKKIVLWYNHKLGNILTDLAAGFCHKVFYVSPFAYTAKFKKAVMMPAGIDTILFKKEPAVLKKPNSLIFVGRISPVKNLDTLIEAAKILDAEKTDFVLSIYAGAPERDRAYLLKIQELAQALVEKGRIKFMGPLPNFQIPHIYNENEILINLTNPGSLDKVVPEAMACESLVLVSNPSFEGQVPGELKEWLIFKERDSADLAKKMKWLLALSSEEKKQIGQRLASIAKSEHGLDILTNKIFKEMENL